MMIFSRTIDTPVGHLLAVVDDDGALLALPFLDGAGDAYAVSDLAYLGPIVPRDDVAEPVVRELDEYFAGSRRAFSLVLCPRGTEYQRLVWSALVGIPFGETISYGELARRAGRGSARAVGRANATNPIPIVIPCHRVIGANGSLTGYGGGMARKEQLLVHEGAVQPSLRLEIAR